MCAGTADVVTTQPTVYIVDDDPQVRESLELLMRSAGLNVELFTSAEDFLEQYHDDAGPPRCLVLDVRMSGLSGLGLQEKLAAMGTKIPIIIITGYSNVSTAVAAMSAGAVDFIEKPVSEQTLLERISVAIDQDVQYRRQQRRRAEIMAHFMTLSPREREVMELMVRGKQTKQIATRLKIGEKTVAKHRVRVFEKMGVDNVASLVHMVLVFQLIPTLKGIEIEGL